jgi:hypothetical protein
MFQRNTVAKLSKYGRRVEACHGANDVDWVILQR